MTEQFDFEQFFEGAHDMMPRKTHHVDRGKKLGMKSADEILDQTTDGDATYEMTDPESFEMMSSKNKDDVEENAEMVQYATREMLQQGAAMALAMDGMGNIMHVSSEPSCAVEQPVTAEEIGEWFDIANHEFLDRTGNGEKWNGVVNELARRFAEFFDGSYDAFEFAASAYAHRAREWGLMEAQAMVESFDATGTFNAPTKLPMYEMKFRGRTFVVESSTTGYGCFIPRAKKTLMIKSGSRK